MYAYLKLLKKGDNIMYNNNFGYMPNYMQQPSYYANNYMTPNYQAPNQSVQNNVQLVFIDGIESAKAYIVAPNQTVLLKDTASNIIYEKSADAQGKYYLEAYGKVNINKEAPKSEINELKSFFEEKLNTLSSQIEKLNIGGVANE